MTMNTKKDNQENALPDKEGFKRELLDGYFMFRRPMPESGFFQENKTTLEIRDDLQPMYAVSDDEIIDYMTEQGYGMISRNDGSVAWAIWRQAQMCE